MACSIDLSLTNLVLLGALVFAVKKLIAFYQKWKIGKMLEKWDETPKGKIILHTIPRCKTLPCISPYGMKLETFLRLAKIPYEVDTTDPMGPKGKLPWISHNGTHVADSHLCIQYLNKKLGVNLNSGKSDEQLAIAHACRITLEDHFSWGVLQYRWIENLERMSQLWNLSAIFKLMLPLIRMDLKKRMVLNGIGKHTPTQIYQMTGDDLHTVSKLLGSKKYFGGEEPCEDDCAIFGSLSQPVWAMPGSSFEGIVNDDLINLKEYCERMKARCWPDWEDCIHKS